jgi:hypothetical protein
MRRAQENIREAFDYDRETGALVRKFKGGHVRPAGAKKSHTGYTKIGFNGREYPAHRLIWWLVYGELPIAFVDHVNGDKSDNRLCNLRLATDAQNKRNVGKRAHNTSGFKGVTWDKINRRWLAHATLNGIGINLGRHSTKESAAEAYRNFARENHGEFYKEPSE